MTLTSKKRNQSLVGNLEERLRLEYAGIVDENVDRAELGDQAINLGGAPTSPAMPVTALSSRPTSDALHRLVDLVPRRGR